MQLTIALVGLHVESVDNGNSLSLLYDNLLCKLFIWCDNLLVTTKEYLLTHALNNFVDRTT